MFELVRAAKKRHNFVTLPFKSLFPNASRGFDSPDLLIGGEEMPQ